MKSFEHILQKYSFLQQISSTLFNEYKGKILIRKFHIESNRVLETQYSKIDKPKNYEWRSIIDLQNRLKLLYGR